MANDPANNIDPTGMLAGSHWDPHNEYLMAKTSIQRERDWWALNTMDAPPIEKISLEEMMQYAEANRLAFGAAEQSERLLAERNLDHAISSGNGSDRGVSLFAAKDRIKAKMAKSGILDKDEKDLTFVEKIKKYIFERKLAKIEKRQKELGYADENGLNNSSAGPKPPVEDRRRGVAI